MGQTGPRASPPLAGSSACCTYSNWSRNWGKEICWASCYSVAGAPMLLLSPGCFTAKAAKTVVLEPQQHCSCFPWQQPNICMRTTVLKLQSHCRKKLDTLSRFCEQVAILGFILQCCWGPSTTALIQWALGCCCSNKRWCSSGSSASGLAQVLTATGRSSVTSHNWGKSLPAG